MGEEGRPQGVGVGGRRAMGVKGGWGREERPVPPIMAIGTGSENVRLISLVFYSDSSMPAYVVGRSAILRFD